MSCFVSMQIEIDIEMVGVLPICIVKPFKRRPFVRKKQGPPLIVSTPNVFYFYLFLFQ